MKKIILVLLLALIPSMSFAGGRIGQDCTSKGKKLYGRVRIVNVGETFKVKAVSLGEDLRVQTSNTLATTCGRWEIVSIAEDFSIRMVDMGEDFSIRFVEVGNGVP
jgi:hypothetical protein